MSALLASREPPRQPGGVRELADAGRVLVAADREGGRRVPFGRAGWPIGIFFCKFSKGSEEAPELICCPRGDIIRESEPLHSTGVRARPGASFRAAPTRRSPGAGWGEELDMGWLLGVFWWSQAKVATVLSLPAALAVWLYSLWWKDRSTAEGNDSRPRAVAGHRKTRRPSAK